LLRTRHDEVAPTEQKVAEYDDGILVVEEAEAEKMELFNTYCRPLT
jgi:hypothetical protein